MQDSASCTASARSASGEAELGRSCRDLRGELFVHASCFVRLLTAYARLCVYVYVMILRLSLHVYCSS